MRGISCSFCFSLIQGTDGMDGPEQIWLKAPEEVRFAECYLAFCVDRDETPEESKNFVFCGVRQQVHMEHLTWARYACGVVPLHERVSFKLRS